MEGSGRHVALTAEETFERMSPEERVGQLFLISFYSNPALDDPLSDVIDLIEARKIGGIVLQDSSNTFDNAADRPLPEEVAAIVDRLQAASLSAAGSGVPLFIAVDHEGDGDPLTHLREGFTAVPSQMALGATWDPGSAEAIGEIVGRELADVGVNVLLGPVLDVLADPRVDSGGDIGTRVFGGHPHWVARMGGAYIRGVHEGAGGRVMTVAKHFPGHGGSDRNPDQVAGTVYKSLADLKRIELPPFAAVTQPDSASRSEALMTSHIRYSGFQGDNIMDVTPPVSFDRASMREILALEDFGFQRWRDGGGIIVSDSLGVNAVKRYFDRNGDAFNHREVARQAFMAGNDVLILSQFGIGGPSGSVAWSVQLPNIRDTVAFFAEEYRRSADFRARVDEAVLRILRQKRSIAPEWSVAALEASRDPGDVGRPEDAQRVAAIARDALTVLRANQRPKAGDRIVVITQDPDARGRHPLACKNERCGLERSRWERLRTLGPTLVEGMLLEKYGPGGSGVIAGDRIRSLSFCQLEAALRPQQAPSDADESPAPESAAAESEAPESEGSQGESAAGAGPTVSKWSCLNDAERPAVLDDLARADWVILAFADFRNKEQVNVLNAIFLYWLEQLDLTRAHLAVLSFGRPHYLDSTNLTRLGFHAAAYSKIPASIEAAVDALMDPLWSSSSTANLPISYEEAGYVLGERVAPDPAQSLSLELEGAPLGRTLPVTVRLRMGPILDRNGNTVPDGTLVEFRTQPESALRGSAPQTRTVGGIATTELSLAGGGEVVIEGISGDAKSDAIRLSLPSPSPTPTPTRAAGGGGDATDAGAVSGERGPPPPAGERRSRPGPTDLLLALAAIVLVAGGASSRGPRPAEAQLRSLLLVAAGGLLAYLLMGGGLRFGLLPFAEAWSAGSARLAIALSALLGSCLGWAISVSPAAALAGRSARGGER